MEIQRCSVSNAQRWFLLWASIQKGLARARWQNWAVCGEQQATPGVSLQISSMCPPRSSPVTSLQVSPVCPRLSLRCPPPRR